MFNISSCEHIYSYRGVYEKNSVKFNFDADVFSKLSQSND